MIQLPHDKNTGFIDSEILAPYQPFGFWDRIKMGGVGSPKTYYISGIGLFDEIILNKTDLPMVNFEITGLAMLIKLSIQSECYTVLIPKKDILKIKSENILSTNKTLYKNILHIFIQDKKEDSIVFEFIPGLQNAVEHFFKKEYFSFLTTSL